MEKPILMGSCAMLGAGAMSIASPSATPAQPAIHQPFQCLIIVFPPDMQFRGWRHSNGEEEPRPRHVASAALLPSAAVTDPLPTASSPATARRGKHLLRGRPALAPRGATIQPLDTAEHFLIKGAKRRVGGLGPPGWSPTPISSQTVRLSAARWPS